MNGDSESFLKHGEEWAMLIRLKDCWQRNISERAARTSGINGRDANDKCQRSNSGRFLPCQKRDALVTTVGSLHILWLKHKEYIYIYYIYTPQKI